MIGRCIRDLLPPGPFARLRQAGILGMNERNADYVMAHNHRSRLPLVDDKRQTKRLAESAGIAVPRLLGVVSSNCQLRGLHELFQSVEGGFVIKPAHGSGGSGILAVRDRLGERYRLCSGRLASRADIEHHVGNVLSGMHSLSELPDDAMFEERIRFDERFDDVCGGGVPDIRTVVYRGVPVMAMLRLPTHASDGKANLHQGAVGVGIDLATGLTRAAVHHNRPVRRHPDSLEPLLDRPVPGWDRLLDLAARCHGLCGLGYLGVDIMLDRDRGPLVLELNARPGLAVQLASQAGLRDRLQIVDRLAPCPADAGERAAFARHHFGGPEPTAPDSGQSAPHRGRLRPVATPAAGARQPTAA